MEINNNNSRYRWYVLTLAAVTLAFCLAIPQICMSVLFDEISTQLGLTVTQVGWIWGFYPLSSLFTVFIAGVLADRFGARRILIIACILTGLAGASRGLAFDFISLISATFLFGFLAGIIPANLLKASLIWFPSRQLGVASGILTAGMGAGFTIASLTSATILSPVLGGWNRVLFLYGGITIFIAMIWLTTVRDQESAMTSLSKKRGSLRDMISQVLHNKNVWLICLAMMGYVGCIEGMNGYLPLYLRDVKGWLPAGADGTLALFTGISTLGAIPISLLSDKIGRRKVFNIPIILAAIIGVGLLSIADGLMIWVIIILMGIGRDGLMALSNASIMDCKGIGMVYSGTALGLLQTITRLGNSISPPMGNSMASIWPGLPFLIWAIFGIFSLICFSLSEETGHYRR